MLPGLQHHRHVYVQYILTAFCHIDGLLPNKMTKSFVCGCNTTNQKISIDPAPNIFGGEGARYTHMCSFSTTGHTWAFTLVVNGVFVLVLCYDVAARFLVVV